MPKHMDFMAIPLTDERTLEEVRLKKCPLLQLSSVSEISCTKASVHVKVLDLRELQEFLISGRNGDEMQDGIVYHGDPGENPGLQPRLPRGVCPLTAGRWRMRISFTFVMWSHPKKFII